MNSEDYKELILELAYEWARARLPGKRISYGNCIELIAELLLITRDRDRTREIFMAVLSQAIDLDKTSAWVENELFFEVMAITFDGNREDALKYDLKLTKIVGDQALDLYNERRKRFLQDN
ncbi:hypothetical protein GCM10028808_47990 [Spirosoma migulaei]